MNETGFWTIIADCDTRSGGDMEQKDQLINTSISELSAADALAFNRLFDQFIDRAYTWSLWGAAYVINGGGCGDDAFMDFRECLISKGKRVFETAVTDPDSLASEDLDRESWFHEGFQYAIMAAVKSVIGTPPKRASPPPASPSGDRFPEDRFYSIYPQLAARMAQRRPTSH